MGAGIVPKVMNLDKHSGLGSIGEDRSPAAGLRKGSGGNAEHPGLGISRRRVLGGNDGGSPGVASLESPAVLRRRERAWQRSDSSASSNSPRPADPSSP